MAIVKSHHLADIIILVCCSISLFTHYIRLLISRLQVQVLSGAPAIPTDYRELSFFQRVISKKEMPQWKKDLIFVVVFIGENLGEDRFYICKILDIQEIIYDVPRDIVP